MAPFASDSMSEQKSAALSLSPAPPQLPNKERKAKNDSGSGSAKLCSRRGEMSLPSKKRPSRPGISSPSKEAAKDDAARTRGTESTSTEPQQRPPTYSGVSYQARISKYEARLSDGDSAPQRREDQLRRDTGIQSTASYEEGKDTKLTNPKKGKKAVSSLLKKKTWVPDGEESETKGKTSPAQDHAEVLLSLKRKRPDTASESIEKMRHVISRGCPSGASGSYSSSLDAASERPGVSSGVSELAQHHQLSTSHSPHSHERGNLAMTSHHPCDEVVARNRYSIGQWCNPPLQQLLDASSDQADPLRDMTGNESGMTSLPDDAAQRHSKLDRLKAAPAKLAAETPSSISSGATTPSGEVADLLARMSHKGPVSLRLIEQLEDALQQQRDQGPTKIDTAKDDEMSMQRKVATEAKKKALAQKLSAFMSGSDSSMITSHKTPATPQQDTSDRLSSPHASIRRRVEEEKHARKSHSIQQQLSLHGAIGQAQQGTQQSRSQALHCLSSERQGGTAMVQNLMLRNLHGYAMGGATNLPPQSNQIPWPNHSRQQDFDREVAFQRLLRSHQVAQLSQPMSLPFPYHPQASQVEFSGQTQLRNPQNAQLLLERERAMIMNHLQRSSQYGMSLQQSTNAPPTDLDSYFMRRDNNMK